MVHHLSLIIIMKECHNNKTSLLNLFIDLKIKSFDIVARENIFNRLKQIKVTLSLGFL